MRHALAALALLFIATPLLAVIPVSQVEGDAGVSVVSITVTHDPQMPPATYSWQTADGTATAADNDYVPTSGSVVLGVNGVNSATINVDVLGDTKSEGDETFTLNVTNVANGPYEITIVDDDPAEFVVSNASVVEGNSGTAALEFQVSLTTPPKDVVTASWQTGGGSATPDVDYVSAQGSVTLGPDQPVQTITVLVNGDTAVEPDETLFLTVTPPGGAAATGTGVIVNDDALSLSVSSPSVQEGNEGTRSLTFDVTLASPSASVVTASYQTGGGSATAGVDYTAAQGTLTFDPGLLTRSVTVAVNGDTLVEPDETFSLTVTAPGAGSATGVGRIVNDDTLALSVSSPSPLEGNAGTTPATFEILLAAPSATEVVAAYVTEAGTATAGQDFVPAQGSVRFAPEQTRATVSVTVNGDLDFEADETFTLAVTAPGAGTARGTATIRNDDTAPAASLTIVGGNDQQGILGTTLAQPLVVEVRDVRGGPSAGTAVQWRVTRGAAQLDPATSNTDAQGRATTRVTLESVGTIEVEASVAGLTPVRFTLGSSTSLEIRARGPVAVPVARVLDQICARNEQAFAAVCRALAGLSDVTPALERIAPQPSGVQAKIATEFANTIASDIRERLSALRRGTGRLSVQRLSLLHRGRAIPVATLASAFLPQATDAGAPEDEFSGWSAFLSGNLGDGERMARNGQLGFDLETKGVTFGIDRLIGASGVVGASLNWMSLDSDLSQSAGSVDTTGYALSLYASRGGLFAGDTPNRAFDGIHVDGSVTFGRNSYDTEHVVDVAGIAPSTARSENDAGVFALSAATGIDAHRGRSDFDFSLSGTWSRSDIDDLTEEGSGPLILFVQGHEVESLVATAGMSARAAWPVPFGVLMPSFRAEMVHEFKSGARLVTARFLRDTQGLSFTVPIDQPDSNYGKLAAGLQAEFGYGYSAFVEVTQDVARSDLHFRTLQFNVRKAFR